METHRQKLDILIMDDKYKLSPEELLKRAQEAAKEDSKIYGWRSIEVRKSAKEPAQNGEFLRHEFDVYGLPSENIDVPSEQQSAPTSSSKPKAAAAPDAGV